MRLNFLIISYLLLVVGVIAVRGHQPSDPLTYKGILSSAAHEEAEGVFNLVEGSTPVLTIIVPKEYQREELRPFIGKKITLTIQEGIVQVITKDFPQ
jgi:hypothetical protein